MGSVLPLLALRAFTEAGRCGSLKAAADVLGVTPGAVSQQIRVLEQRLNVSLFVRERYGVQLSEAGARIHPNLVRAFDQIEHAVSVLEAASKQQTLTVSTVASFAASWLVPRLGAFSALHPEIEVRVEASSKLADLQRDGVDVAIRHGLGVYPGLQVERLMAPVLLPVASPSLLAQGPAIRKPADCLKYTLLHDSDRADWALWLQAHGVEPEDAALRGPGFEEDLLLLRAAAAGQGIALVQDTHAQEYLDEGRLVVALNKRWPARFAYYLVSKPGATRRPAVKAFSEWVMAQAASPARAPSASSR
ncbi:MAG: transcriptional regulator GcvA [Pseudomonadota bacterium]